MQFLSDTGFFLKNTSTHKEGKTKHIIFKNAIKTKHLILVLHSFTTFLGNIGILNFPCLSISIYVAGVTSMSENPQIININGVSISTKAISC